MGIERYIREKRIPPMTSDFSPVRRAGLNLHFSGIGSRDPETGECVGIIERDADGSVLKYDFEQQYNRAMLTLRHSLAAFDLGLDALIELEPLLINKADWDTLNDLWRGSFKDVPRVKLPARTTAFWSGLPLDNFIELKALARLTPFQFIKLALQRRLP